MIRKPGLEDVDEIFRLIQDTVAGLRAEGIDQWDEIYPSRADIMNDIISESAWAAYEGSRPAAYIVLNEEIEPQYDEVEFQYTEGLPLIIHRLSVHPDFSGKGLGTELVRFAETEALKRGYSVVRLDAFSKNPAALRLYEKSGYRRAGEVSFRKGRFYLYEKALLSS